MPCSAKSRRCGSASMGMNMLRSCTGRRTRLELRGIVFKGDFLDLSRCPVLQDLEIVDCAFVLAGRFSSESLKRLRIKGAIFNWSSRTHIHAPNLTTLHLQYIFRRDLKCCPTFSRLKSLMLNETCCVPDLFVLARYLELSPVLEKLRLILFYKLLELNVIMKGRFNPKELPPTISAHLKKVEVTCGAVDERVIQVLKFLSEFNISFSFTQEKLKGED